ncbi:PKD domain protein [uncultured archaeon]|nr:PKD domain protein [uncultured archaeon]
MEIKIRRKFADDMKDPHGSSGVALVMACFFFLIFSAQLMQTAVSASWPDCKFQCEANDVTVSHLWLGDGRGSDISSGAPGEKVPCYLWAEFHNNANSPRHAVILLADMYINGTLSRSFYDDGLCVLDSIEPKATTAYPIYSLTWSYGDKVYLSRLVLSWETASKTTCSNANRKCSNRNTKCYGGDGTEYVVETPLVARFSFSGTGCRSGGVSFLDGSTGGFGPYAYNWDFGDRSKSHEKNPSHIYKNPGNYTALLQVTDQSGRTASASQELQVQSCSCLIAGENSACLDRIETYRVSLDGSLPLACQWKINGSDAIGSVSEGGVSIDINWQDYGPGQHDLQAIVMNKDGTRELGNCNMIVNVQEMPVATITMMI